MKPDSFKKIGPDLLAFQLLLKGCTIEAHTDIFVDFFFKWFQLLLKGCTIEALGNRTHLSNLEFQLLLKGCTIEAVYFVQRDARRKFQLLLKGCTIEAVKLRYMACGE